MPIETKEELALAQLVETQIRLHPESHDQNIWHEPTPCGTQACIAGWTAALAPGATIIRPTDSYLSVSVNGGEAEPIDWFASRALGLAGDEVDWLFFDYDDESALAKLQSYIADGITYLAELDCPRPAEVQP